MNRNDPNAKSRIDRDLIARPKPMRRGGMRLALEAERIERIKASAATPHTVGLDIQPSIARGAFQEFTPRETIKGANGEFRSVRSGHRGHNAIRIADAFDRMQEQARRRARSRGVDVPELFTTAQIETGRVYAELVSRLRSAGLKLSCLDGSGGGGSSDGHSEQTTHRLARLSRMEAAIGDEIALAPKRASGRERQVIAVRRLVHCVCIREETLSEVLTLHGWSWTKSTREPAREALRAALDRMYDC